MGIYLEWQIFGCGKFNYFNVIIITVIHVNPRSQLLVWGEKSLSVLIVALKIP